MSVAKSHRERAQAIAADYGVASWANRVLVDAIEKALTEAVAEEREPCAFAVECMMVGGRAWTEEQAAAAEVLTAAAKSIRTRPT